MSEITQRDLHYMRHALELAKRGAGHVSPNPMVGAVIVKDDRIIGEGWHEHIGGLHAERNAFKNCTEDCTGATMLSLGTHPAVHRCDSRTQNFPCRCRLSGSKPARCRKGSAHFA